MKKNMSEERALFRRALCEGLARKYEEALAAYPEPVPCSEEHLRKINAIIESHAKSVKQAKYKRRLTALLLAAALLLLTACAAYAYRGEIKKIVVQFFESHMNLVYDEEDSNDDIKIKTHYTLGYVPEGYELTEELQGWSIGKHKWINKSGSYIMLEQFFWDGTVYSIDSETGESTTIICGNIEIYYRITQSHTYIWNDGTYSFRISVSQPLSEDELAMLIVNIKVVH